jgi:hypothetical protein
MVPGIWWTVHDPVDLVCLKEARRRGDEAAGKGSGSAQTRPFEPEEATGHKLDHARRENEEMTLSMKSMSGMISSDLERGRKGRRSGSGRERNL